MSKMPTHRTKCLHLQRVCSILQQIVSYGWFYFSGGNNITFCVLRDIIGWSLTEFHICKFSLQGNDCFQNRLECHEDHVFPLHQLSVCNWVYATCMRGCSDPTARLPRCCISLTDFSHCLVTNVASLAFLKTTTCIYCGKCACCFLVRAHSCWKPEFK